MTVSLGEPVQVGANAWELRWSSDAESPLYRVYRNGTLIMQTRTCSAVFTIPENEAHAIEVLDNAGVVARAFGRPNAKLGWAATAGAIHYIVEQYTGGEWVLVGTVQETGKQRWHAYIAALGDDATHQFRVTAVNKAGAGTPATVTYTLVRMPDPPHVQMVYDAGTGDVVVAAA